MEHNTKSTITLPINPDRTHVSHAALRTIAPQAKFVAEKYQDSHPAITVQAPGVIEVSQAFIVAYDASRTKSPDASQEIKELHESTRALQTSMQAWMGALVTSAPQIDLSSFANASRSPKGIIADAERLVELVGKHVQAGQPIAFAQQVIAELGNSIASANAELMDVLEIEASHAEVEQRVRELGIELNAKLVGLRRTLRVVLGKSHPHYRALLVRRRGAASMDPIDESPADEAGAMPAEGKEPEAVR